MSSKLPINPMTVSLMLAAVIILLCLNWLVHRAFIDVEIDTNEAWNAYFADAAVGRISLYPPRDSLITNNYPPISFYLVGMSSRLVGDPILAGRLLSILALFAIGAGVALCVRRLTGDATGAIVGALYYLATMCRFHDGYVGMNDPHLLGQAVMVAGFVLFLKAVDDDRGYASAFLTLVAAGFIKHNLFVTPLVSLIWLRLRRPARFGPIVALSAGAVVAGLASCYCVYGPEFFFNLLSPRQIKWMRALTSLGKVQGLGIGLAAWAFVGVALRKEPAVRLLNIFVLLGLVFYCIQITGEGVADNAQFELVFAVSVAMGVAYAATPRMPAIAGIPARRLRSLFFIAMLVRLLAWPQMEPIRLVVDPAFEMEIRDRERAMADTIARVRDCPGPVLSDSYACYRAGKPFAVDRFNANQRIAAGRLPANAIDSAIEQGRLTAVEPTPGLCWGQPLSGEN